MKKLLAGALGAILGTLVAVALHCSLMLVKVPTAVMLPELEPGERVLVYLLSDRKAIELGDIVAFRLPYYTLDGEEEILLRRVVKIQGASLVVSCDADTTDQGQIEILREDVLGKVLLR